uniref:Uncharacterized protein n=1 Tax=Globodera pallida TaxID=36090 RepID=A0A183BY19_GLOPA
MQQPPPVHPSGVPSSSVLLDHQQQQLVPLQYHYALQQPQHQGTPFPLIPSSAVDPPNSVASSSASVCSLPAQFQHLYPLGGSISNFTDTGQQQQQQQQSSTAFTTMPPHSSGISETVKTEQQKQQPNGTTSKAEQRNNGNEIGKKIAEEKGRIEEEQRSVYAQAQQPADQPHAVEQPAPLHDDNTKSICKELEIVSQTLVSYNNAQRKKSIDE